LLAGLQTPFLTEYDPGHAGEGSIDPLGLAPLADRLAEEIVPWVTARMSRIRFLTAIAATSVVTQDLAEIPPADTVTTPYIAVEWHVIEAFGRERRLPREAVAGVPGILKARSVVARGGHLDALAYLKGPKVFGFHGIYKRLARGVGIVDDELLLAERGDQLVRAWEFDRGMPGFADRRPGSPGGHLARRLARAALQALLQGHVVEPHGSHLWVRLVRNLRPDEIGPREGKLLAGWLTEASSPLRREVLVGLRSLRSIESEATALREIRPKASTELAVRLDAVEAYERVAEILVTAFDLIRRASTSQGWVRLGEVAKHPLIARCAKEISSALAGAGDQLADLGLEVELDRVTGGFADVREPGDLADRLLSHHSAVQAQKPPGKRPWFEQSSSGVIVRAPYRLEEEPEITRRYVHPYRVRALQQFIEDLA
jgi:hypothetical protein